MTASRNGRDVAHKMRLSLAGVFLLLTGPSTAFVALLALPGCNTPARFCGDVGIRVLPGACSAMPNPCEADHGWLSNLDGFRLEDHTEMFSIRTDRRNGETKRAICADPSAPLVTQQDVGYTYGSGVSLQRGHIFITTTPAMEVHASAMPDTIQRGQSTQLHALVQGGVPPFEYIWSPADTVSDPPSPTRPHRRRSVPTTPCW